MTTLLVKSQLNLTSSWQAPYSLLPNGPLFSRWLPDGEKDAICLLRSESLCVKVWFERLGFERDGFIRFDSKRREIDPEALSRQFPVDGGPMMAQLEWKNFSEADTIRNAAQGDEGLVRLARQIADDLLYPSLSRFADILRTNYGQYWLVPIKKWDSRTENLGSYCSHLNLSWSLDNGQTWQELLPEKPVSTFRVAVGARDRNISFQDWQELQRAVEEGYHPSVAAQITSDAHSLLDGGDLKHALIEGVTALEVAIKQFIDRKTKAGNVPGEELKAFWDLPRKTQLAALAVNMAGLDPNDLALALQAIEMRNDVVHEGYVPPPDTQGMVAALLRVTSTFLQGPPFKFPSIRQAKHLSASSSSKL